MQALYEDIAEILKKELAAAEIFLAGFNVKIAPRIGTNSITPYELAEYIHIAGPKEAEIITTLARAKAELAFGNRLAACPLIAEAIRQAESPEELGDLLGNSAADKRRARGQKPLVFPDSSDEDGMQAESPEELGDLLGNSAADKRRARGQKPQ